MSTSTNLSLSFLSTGFMCHLYTLRAITGKHTEKGAVTPSDECYAKYSHMTKLQNTSVLFFILCIL